VNSSKKCKVNYEIYPMLSFVSPDEKDSQFPSNLNPSTPILFPLLAKSQSADCSIAFDKENASCGQTKACPS
jgi:hypothetical protein